RLTLLRGHLEGAAGVGRVDEAGGSLPAALEDGGIRPVDLRHLRLRDGPVVQRGAPVWAALEHGEVARRLRDLGDGLDPGGAGADDGHALPLEGHRMLGPEPGVVGLAAIVLHAGNTGQGRRGQWTDRGDEIARATAGAAFQADLPPLAILVPRRGL